MQLYVADDNEEFSDFVARVAERAGWDVTICVNGHQLATAVAAKEGPALLIVDINMPEMDGIEVIEELKNIQRQLRIRFITGGLQTSALAARMIAKARGMEAGRFLAKPLPMHELQAILQSEANLLYD